MRDRQGGYRQHEFPTVSRGGGFDDGVKIGAVDKVEFQRSCTVYPPHDAEEENRIGDRQKSGTDEQHLQNSPVTPAQVIANKGSVLARGYCRLRLPPAGGSLSLLIWGNFG